MLRNSSAEPDRAPIPHFLERIAAGTREALRCKIRFGGQRVGSKIQKVDIESNTTFLQVKMVNGKACIFEADGWKNDFRNEVIDAREWNICQPAMSPPPAYLPNTRIPLPPPALARTP